VCSSVDANRRSRYGATIEAAASNEASVVGPLHPFRCNILYMPSPIARLYFLDCYSWRLVSTFWSGQRIAVSVNLNLS
jgi:hypothetical protein